MATTIDAVGGEPFHCPQCGSPLVMEGRTDEGPYRFCCEDGCDWQGQPAPGYAVEVQQAKHARAGQGWRVRCASPEGTEIVRQWYRTEAQARAAAARLADDYQTEVRG